MGNSHYLLQESSCKMPRLKMAKFDNMLKNIPKALRFAEKNLKSESSDGFLKAKVLRLVVQISS